jgi:hypothetical protein
VTSTNEYSKYVSQTVKKFWYGYKVCEGCDSLITEDIYVCPRCKAYRFDDSKKAVLKAADELIKLTEDSI